DAAGHSALELGFSTFFLNRTNRSGIISGGVIGGKKQTGTWKLDARYNKRDLIGRIQRIARYKNRISLYCKDGKDFIRLVLPKLPKRTLVYVDPPYYAKGQNLYRNLFTQRDHESLAASIQRRIHQPWIVSYDAVPPVVALYRDRRVRRYYLSYSAQMRYSGQEVMFFSDDLVLPTASHPVISRRRR
ncbi:MAG: DNA adenine methylase, partial [candidate division Zixibacteria bacterium]|nr:DNA adenine methylase [candidate division Zixibacteria bacterium]